MDMLHQDNGYIRAPLSRSMLTFRLAFYSGRNDEARRILNAVLQSDHQLFLRQGLAFPAWQLGVSGWEQSLSAAGSVEPEGANLAKEHWRFKRDIRSMLSLCLSWLGTSTIVIAYTGRGLRRP